MWPQELLLVWVPFKIWKANNTLQFNVVRWHPWSNTILSHPHTRWHPGTRIFAWNGTPLPMPFPLGKKMHGKQWISWLCVWIDTAQGTQGVSLFPSFLSFFWTKVDPKSETTKAFHSNHPVPTDPTFQGKLCLGAQMLRQQNTDTGKDNQTHMSTQTITEVEPTRKNMHAERLSDTAQWRKLGFPAKNSSKIWKHQWEPSSQTHPFVPVYAPLVKIFVMQNTHLWKHASQPLLSSVCVRARERQTDRQRYITKIIPQNPRLILHAHLYATCRNITNNIVCCSSHSPPVLMVPVVFRFQHLEEIPFLQRKNTSNPFGGIIHLSGSEHIHCYKLPYPKNSTCIMQKYSPDLSSPFSKIYEKQSRLSQHKIHE